MEPRWDHDLPGGSPGYHDFVLNRASEQPFSRTATWRSSAVARTRSLLSFATGSSSKPDFLAEAPKPDPDLRITPASDHLGSFAAWVTVSSAARRFDL